METYQPLAGRKKLIVIPGASHTFEEPGSLEEAARLFGAWFTRHLTVTPHVADGRGNDEAHFGVEPGTEERE